MGLWGKLHTFASEHPIITAATIGGGLVLGYAIYCYFAEDQLEDTPISLKDLEELASRYNPQSQKDVEALIRVRHQLIQQVGKRGQQRFIQKRMKARKEGMTVYLETIVAGLEEMNAEVERMDGKILQTMKMSKQYLERIYKLNTELISRIYMDEQGKVQGEVLGLREVQAVLTHQSNYLSSPHLLSQLKQAVRNLPQSILSQMALCISVIVTDEIRDKFGYDQNTVSKSFMINQKSISADMQKQQLLMIKLLSEIHPILKAQVDREIKGYMNQGGFN